jgi:hypothetical protein
MVYSIIGGKLAHVEARASGGRIVEVLLDAGILRGVKVDRWQRIAPEVGICWVFLAEDDVVFIPEFDLLLSERDCTSSFVKVVPVGGVCPGFDLADIFVMHRISTLCNCSTSW